MDLVKKLKKHYIYYVYNDKIKYYINVPYIDFNKTNISLEFLEETNNYDPDLNDIEWVKNNIIEYYEKVDDDNITLVMPILKDNEKNVFLSLDNNSLFFIEKIMSLYINSCYDVLTKNNVVVDKNVFLIENDKFEKFINYFKKAHNSRITVKKLIEISNKNDIINLYNNDKVNNLDRLLSINEKYLKDKNLDFKNNIDNNLNNIIDKNTTNEKSNLKDEKENNDIINNGKVKNIIIPDKNESINNVINIKDLGSLTASGLGGLPGNVTINIEKLVTENDKIDEKNKDTEISELDEDISDVDDFELDDDFDLDAIDVSEAVLTNDDSNKNYKTITSGGINFVVGKKDDTNIKPIEINKPNSNIDLENNNLKIDIPTNIVKGDDQINKSAGFASYFTLFFVAISALFIIVYIVVK